jgi:hypothetical protein
MLKVNTDPDCPGADIRKGDNLNSWDIQHKDRGKFSMASIPKARWQEIFGPKEDVECVIQHLNDDWPALLNAGRNANRR